MSVIFVFIVIFLFLGSFRSLLVPIVTIPLSILGGAFVMLCLGYSLNSLTMLSWVLAIGLVVDDAIVVIENIHRYIEKGMSSLEASLIGVKEIAPSIVAMTLVVAVNFIPIGFMPGFSGALFKEFAFTMAIVVMFSGVLALFVSPAMCCGLLRPQKPKDLSVKIDHIMQKFCKKYQAVLEIVLAWKYFILILFVIGILGGFFISKQIKSEMTPVEPDGVVVAFGLGPEGRNLDYTVKYGNTLNKVFSNIKAGTVYGVFYGFGIPSPLANQVNGFISLNSLQIEDAVMAEIQEAFSKVAGMLSLAFPMPTLPGNQAMQPINFVLKTNGSYEHLYMALQTLIKETANYPSIAPGGQGDLKYSTPQVSVELNRDKAQSLGVSADDVNNTLNLMLGRPVVGRFPMGGYSFEIVPTAMREYKNNPSDIGNYYLKNFNGDLLPLDSVVSINENAGPNVLNEFSQLHAAMFTASVGAGHTLGESLSDLEAIVKTKLPKDIQVDYAFQSREYIDSQGVLLHAFIVAIVIIYFLLCLQYNNFVHPLTVMLSVPLCLVGAIYTLYLYGGTFNLYTKIGLIMLVGLISKHGILIVSFADEYLKEHKGEIKDAVVYAAGVRLRPILMTTAAMVLGALPLVLFQGAGAGSRHQIGWVIIGGMCFGTCLSLFVVPCAFLILNHKRFGAFLCALFSLSALILSGIYTFNNASLVYSWILLLFCLLASLFSLYLVLHQKRALFWWIMLFLVIISIILSNFIGVNIITYLFAIALFGGFVDYFYRIRKI